jgi:hypothetical protein
MDIKITFHTTSPVNFHDHGRPLPHFQPHQLGGAGIQLDDADIRDTSDSQSPVSFKATGVGGDPMTDSLLDLLGRLLETLFNKNANPADSQDSDPADIGGPSPASKKSPFAPTSLSEAPGASESNTPTTGAGNVAEAAANTHPQFKPIIRGDEAQKDAQITDQASFARAADQVAKEYGLDPNQFRAQLEVESGAFSQGYKKAMKHEGDLDRASENNTSIGLGQISRKFLDGRDWSNDGPNNHRVGGQSVSTEQYMNSPITQLRVAAANLAMRAEDNDGLEKGLRYYVSGLTTPNAKNNAYLENINKHMQDQEMMNLGR